MGNVFTSNSKKSAEKEFKNFYEIMDYIATYYILTMDFKSLSKLAEKEYCDNLVVLTSDIIKRYFNDMEITYLAQRIKNGVEVNDLTKENVIFFNKNQLDSLDISNDTQKTIKKKRVCIGIAKFYVKIAHIFAAIVTTVNPIYTYKNENGETVKTGLMEKDTIPKNSNRKLFKLNICDNRIRALQNDEELDEATGNVTIHPTICDFNVNKDGQIKNLGDEPGIPELMTLYLDDNYDYSTGTFTGMSDDTKKLFQKDLKTFYTAFTGNDVMPPNITKFSDIKLRNYDNRKGCQGDLPVFQNKYVTNKNDKLFMEYAKNTKKMIQTAADNQTKLLSVINELFTYVIDPYNGKKKIRIHPNLTEASLQKNVEKTRKYIIDLYVKCELDYVNGIKLYEAIVESKILYTTEKQITTLKKEAKKIIEETTEIVKPETDNSVTSTSSGLTTLPTDNSSDTTSMSPPPTTSEPASVPPPLVPIQQPEKTDIKAENDILNSLANTSSTSIPSSTTSTSIPSSTTSTTPVDLSTTPSLTTTDLSSTPTVSSSLSINTDLSSTSTPLNSSNIGTSDLTNIPFDTKNKPINPINPINPIV